MKFHRIHIGGLICWSIGLAVLAPGGRAAQATPAETIAPKAANPADSAGSGTKRAEVYYNYTMGHIAEQMYESTSSGEYATQALEYYKKAYALDPASPVIGERLAEMYWKAQRLKEAIQEAQQILKRDPDNLATRRLLGRIYLRSLGGLSTTVTVGGRGGETPAKEFPSNQAEIIRRAI